ncbi:MAG: PAS domain S-box protein [Thermoplasmatota archaeon]
MRVLLVDDEPGIVEQGKIFLEREGNFFLEDKNEKLNVDSVQAIGDAMEKLENEDFDAVVSDYKMPDKTGIDLLKTLRDRGNDIPFIMFTGKGWEEVAMKALNNGADQYLQKGWDPKAQYGVLAKSIVQVVEKNRNQKMYETLFETAKDAFFIMDGEEFIECNQGALDMFNCDRADIIGEEPYMFSPETQPDGSDSGELSRRRINRALNGKSQYFEWVHQTYDGEKFDAEVVLNSMDISGKRYLMSIVRDITGRKEAQKKLKEEKDKLQKYIDVADVIMLVLDKDKDIKMINQTGYRILGCEEGNMIGQNWVKNFIPEPSREDAFNKFDKLLNDNLEDQTSIIQSVITKRGRERIVEWNYKILEDEKGEKSILASGNDITDLKQAEEKFRTFFDEIRDGIFVTTIGGEDAGKIIEANPAASEMTGYSINELKGKNIIEDISVIQSEELKHGIRESELLEEGEIRLTEKKRKKDGSEFWSEVVITPIEFEGEEVALSVNRDISGRKETEQELKESKDKIEKLHEIAVEMESAKTREEVFELTIEAAEKVLEFDLCTILIPEGNELVVKASSSKVSPENQKHMPMDDSIAGKTYSHHKKFMIDDLHEDKESYPNSEKYKSGISIPVGNHGVFQAKSLKKSDFDENDLEMAELLMSHVNNALTRIQSDDREEFLLTLLRHDLKNKTQVIRGYLQILEDADIPAKYKDMIDKTMNATIEGQELLEKVGTLKDINREEEVREVNVDMYLRDAIEKNRTNLEEDIDLEYDGISIDVMGGPLLKELFYNIIENSALHSEGDKIKISVKEEENNIKVNIEDNGVGIEEDKKDEIFQRGYKGRGSKGLGIGLHLTKNIAENYGGTIKVDDSELGGAKFKVVLKRP